MQPSQANAAARRWFAQGMAQGYAFNRPEAIRAFKAALAQDPDCALCAWGVALQMGPNINNPKRGDVGDASRYADYAIAHSKESSARDLALITSLATRYGPAKQTSQGQVLPLGEICRSASSAAAEPADRLDIAYAEDMRNVLARFPDDPDVLALYAEAEMIATPGERWDLVTKKPSGRIGDVADMLEAGLLRYPDHIGLNHYLIHAVDAVPVAERALAAADRLGKLAPHAAHLLHMPAHTYVHLGRYADATLVNQMAVAADDAMMLELKRQRFSSDMDWRDHSLQFEWYSALMEGHGDVALAAARAAAGRAKGDNEYGEYVRSLPMLTMLSLHRWDLLIKEPLPRGGKGMATVLGEMAHGIALLHNGQADGARAALDRLTPKAQMLLAKHSGNGVGASMVRSLVGSAQTQLHAEIAFANKQIDAALTLQSQAIAAAAFAEHSEPPALAGGPLHRLGSMQLRANRFAEAERTFRVDLGSHPGNGWALHGLALALSAQGKEVEANVAKQALAHAWASADQQLRFFR
ncbi:hypothetical protein ACO0LF_30840 [Undibacterium sp. Di27W]